MSDNEVTEFDESYVAARKRGDRVPVIRSDAFGGGYAEYEGKEFNNGVDYRCGLRMDWLLAKAVLNQDRLAFHARLERINEVLKAKIRHDNIYYEFESLTVEWIAISEKFMVVENDGLERIIREKDLTNLASRHPINEYLRHEQELKESDSQAKQLSSEVQS